jgi:FKBP-type peptidyl-prolyl cis-trans isomerase
MRRLLLLLACALPLLATSCGDATFVEATVADTQFAASLDVDLAEYTVTPSGLYYRDLTTGAGATAAQGNAVAVHYALYLPDGELLESTPANDPYDFQLGVTNLIPGFTEGVRGMKVGGRRQILVPPSLGYGRAGSGPVPPNSVLVFRLELVSVN